MPSSAAVQRPSVPVTDDDDLDLDLEGMNLDENIDTTVSVKSLMLHSQKFTVKQYTAGNEATNNN